MTEPTSEWLKPIDERFLTDDGTRPPHAVRVASVLSGVNALASAVMAAYYVTMTIDLLRGQDVKGGALSATVPLGMTALVLVAVFGLGVVAIVRRGWFRIVIVAGLVLASMALLAVFAGDWRTGRGFTPLVPAIAATAFGLVVAVRLPASADWLAKRRHHTRRRGGRQDRGGLI